MDGMEVIIHCKYWDLIVSAELQKLKAKAITGVFEKHHGEELGKQPVKQDLWEYIWMLQL